MDGTKVRANNSKKTNYSPKKIERHLASIEEGTNEYLSKLDKSDVIEQPEKVKQVQEKVDKLKANKIKYEFLSIALEAKENLTLTTFTALIDKGHRRPTHHSKQ